MTTVVRPNRAVDRLAAVLVLAVGACFALALLGGLFAPGQPGSLLSVPFMILGIVWVTRTMRKAWNHLGR